MFTFYSICVRMTSYQKDLLYGTNLGSSILEIYESKTYSNLGCDSLLLIVSL